MPEFGCLPDGCRFNDCRHLTEPDCAVRAAVTAGRIDPARHAFYAELVAEMDALRRRDAIP
jgi:ribosome biogenesis GTPase